MNKSVLLKIAGVIFIPLLVMIIAFYFLYPYMSEDKYQEVVEKTEAEFENSYSPFYESELTDQPLDSAFVDSVNVDSLGMDSTATPIKTGPIDPVQLENHRLSSMVDSLNMIIAHLEFEIDSLSSINFAALEEAKRDAEEFPERVKSLLNLEEEDLSPILENMSQKQLVRLYFGGGTIQREKILRALSSDKAAELMTEIM